jgi:hypothetical protein
LAAIGLLLPMRGSAGEPSRIDLSGYGLSPDRGSVAEGVFYLAGGEIAVWFDREAVMGVPGGQNLHHFVILVFNTSGQLLAQNTVSGQQDATDVHPGPSGGLIVGQEGSLRFYDSGLRWRDSMLLQPGVISVNYDRRWNQIGILRSATQYLQTMQFLDGSTRQETASFTLPQHRGVFVYGHQELAFDAGGRCETSTRILSKVRSWDSLKGRPLCDLLTFLGDDEVAYVYGKQLYVADSAGKQIAKVSLPIRLGYISPSLAGISDDSLRIAVSAMKANTPSSDDEIVVYDLHANKIVFQESVAGSSPSALSPDGKQFAVLNDTTLILSAVP